MLLLGLEVDQKIIVVCHGERIEIMLTRTSKDYARLGFTAAKHVEINRESIHNLKMNGVSP